jgi:hypothetical protein
MRYRCAEADHLLKSATSVLLQVAAVQQEDAKLKHQTEKQIRVAAQLEHSIDVLEGELQEALQTANHIAADRHAKVCVLRPY